MNHFDHQEFPLDDLEKKKNVVVVVVASGSKKKIDYCQSFPPHPKR